MPTWLYSTDLCSSPLCACSQEVLASPKKVIRTWQCQTTLTRLNLYISFILVGSIIHINLVFAIWHSFFVSIYCKEEGWQSMLVVCHEKTQFAHLHKTLLLNWLNPLARHSCLASYFFRIWVEVARDWWLNNMAQIKFFDEKGCWFITSLSSYEIKSRKSRIKDCWWCILVYYLSRSKVKPRANILKEEQILKGMIIQVLEPTIATHLDYLEEEQPSIQQLIDGSKCFLYCNC